MLQKKKEPQEEQPLYVKFFSSLGIAFGVTIGLILFFMIFLAIFIKITLNN
jgi:tetrahydromethanopterin S-methyltransferase subunit G